MALWLSDRIEYQLRAAEYHLDNLRGLAGRIFETEIAVDGFLVHIIASIDALLQEINEKKGLGLRRKDVTLASVNKKLKGPDKVILREINKITNTQHWLWQLNNYRNHSVHRSIIARHLTVGKMYLVKDPQDASSGPAQKDTISYFEETLDEMKQLVSHVRQRI